MFGFRLVLNLVVFTGFNSKTQCLHWYQNSSSDASIFSNTALNGSNLTDNPH